MDEADLLDLLRPGISATGGTWADLGSGAGAFTFALFELVGPEASIWSVDRDAGALERQREGFRHRHPHAGIHYVDADFAHSLALPPLDGVVMANSLHFQRYHQ